MEANILKLLQRRKLLSKVNFVILFGSHSKGKQTPLSDIDLCLSLNLPPSKRFKARLELLAELPEKYDLQIFEDLPLYVRKEVLAGKVLYVKNKKKLIQTALKVIADFEDFKPLYEFYISRAET